MKTWRSMTLALAATGAMLQAPPAQAAGALTCQSEACFQRQLSFCGEASWETGRAFGGSARYDILGRTETGACRVEMRYTENPNPKWVDKPLRFVLPGRERSEQDLKQAVSTCMGGDSGHYRCDGPLFLLVGGHPPARKAVASPCGKTVADQGAPLFPMRRDGKWGYINRKGEWVIPPRWRHAEPFSEGRAVVDDSSPPLKWGAWGVIDRKGDYVVKPGLRSETEGLSPISPFSEGCAAVVTQNGVTYYIGRDGSSWLKERNPRGLDGDHPQEFGPFSEGKAWFWARMKKHNRYGWMDADGNVIIAPRFGSAGDFHDGLAATTTDNFSHDWGYIDTSGKLSLPGKWSLRWARPFEDGLAAVRGKESRMMRYITRDGRSAIEKIDFGQPHQWEARWSGEVHRKRARYAYLQSAGDFGGGLAPATVGIDWGKITGIPDFTDDVYIDRKGRVKLIPTDNPRIGKVCTMFEFHHGLALLRVDAEDGDCSKSWYVYSDTNGKIVAAEERVAAASVDRRADEPADPDSGQAKQAQQPPAAAEKSAGSGVANRVGQWAADSASDEAQRQVDDVDRRARDELHKAASDAVGNLLHGIFGK